MGDEPPQMATGLYGDDPECGLVGGRGGLEGAEGMEGEDGIIAVCGSWEVYWSGSGVP